MRLDIAPSRHIILGQSGVAVPVGVVTTEAALATIAVPPGAMGLAGCLRITTLWTMTNGANDKIPRVRFGSITGSVYFGTTLTTTLNAHHVCMIWNTGVANAQKGMASINAAFGLTTSAQVTSAIDTAAATNVVISGQKEVDSESLILDAYLVELIT